MSDQITHLEYLEKAENARRARRNFIRMCGGAAAMTGGLSLLAACDNDDDGDVPVVVNPTPTPTAIGDADVLGFALQLEYLEGAYYSAAVFGTPIAASLTTGTGTQGAVTGGRAVTFTDTVLQQYAREIANDEIAHITYLRQQLGSATPAQPAINIDGSATGAFTVAARAAGVVTATQTFDPYASEDNFLLGAYLLTDVGVTAYRGSARLLAVPAFREAAAGILATECYHDATIRSSLYARGLVRPTINTQVQQISDFRDGLDGSQDLDQPIILAGQPNIVPTDGSGLVLGRTAQQVLNVVYGSRASVSQGGFFPAGLNGNIRTSAAN